jgi:hypothetical protein
MPAELRSLSCGCRCDARGVIYVFNVFCAAHADKFDRARWKREGCAPAVLAREEPPHA